MAHTELSRQSLLGFFFLQVLYFLFNETHSSRSSDFPKMLSNIVFCVLFSTLVCLTQSSVPKLGELLPKRSQNVGTKIKILCVVQSGSKPFQFEWFKNDRILQDSHYHMETDQDESELTIRKLEVQDYGNYSCSVHNDHGTDTKWTQIIVTGLGFFDFQTICGAYVSN